MARGLLLLVGLLAGTSLALEKSATVKAENVDSPRVVMRHQNDAFIAEFQIRSIPEFNRYETFLGEEAISADLAPLQVRRATWLIVMDTSDPTGRAEVIEEQKRALMRFLTFISPESRVGLFRISRDLVNLHSEELDLPLGVGMKEPILVPHQQSRGVWMWNPIFQPIDELYTRGANDPSQMNTNLWVGLTRALREELPRMAQGHYANLPKGILLISDGVDESPTGTEDLNQLIHAARSMGVPIHTLAFAHKDEVSNRRDEIIYRHKGFNYLQRLSSETGGLSISYDMFDVDSPDALKLKSIVEATETALLSLSFPMKKLKGGQDVTLELREGQQRCLGRLNIGLYDVAQVIGDYWLNKLSASANSARRMNGEEHEKLMYAMGRCFIQQIATLPIRDDLFAYTEADEPFARRAKQILAHLDANPELLKQARSSEPEMAQMCRSIANALMNFGAPLPELHKEVETPQQPIVIAHALPGGAAMDSSYGDDSLSSWVWWFLGIGGTAAAAMFFWLIARLVGGANAAGGPGRAPHTAGDAGKPALATLENTANRAQKWAICSTSCRVGRHSGNEVSLPFSYVSGVQFILSRGADGVWELRDAHSTNGTMVNGQKVQSARLRNGDTIRIADLELEFKQR